MPNIEPLYIAVLVAIVVGAVWYIQRKKEKKDEIVGRQIEDRIRSTDKGLLDDAVSRDEEEVPKLSAADEIAETQPLEPAVAQMESVRPETEGGQEEPAAEEKPVQAERKEVPSAPIVRRRKPEIDPAVEAIINITPREASFNIEALKQRIADVQAEPLLKNLVRVQCFDKVSGIWYDGADHVTECTQLYLSMLLANRVRCVNQATASKFMIHAEQFAIELKGESDAPDCNEMIQGAERIQRIIQAFDKRLSVKLVAAKDITEEELDAAAKGCGFVKEDGKYEKYIPGIQAPVFHILPPQTLGNEIELSFDVPLMLPASEPLSQFFAIANDLCCRIDSVMTDASGTPIGARAASRIASVLKNMHATMSEHGVPAGSRRTCLIFSVN